MAGPVPQYTKKCQQLWDPHCLCEDSYTTSQGCLVSLSPIISSFFGICSLLSHWEMKYVPSPASWMQSWPHSMSQTGTCRYCKTPWGLVPLQGVFGQHHSCIQVVKQWPPVLGISWPAGPERVE